MLCLEHYFIWIRDLDTNKIGAEVFGELLPCIVSFSLFCFFCFPFLSFLFSFAFFSFYDLFYHSFVTPSIFPVYTFFPLFLLSIFFFFIFLLPFLLSRFSYLPLFLVSFLPICFIHSFLLYFYSDMLCDPTDIIWN